MNLKSFASKSSSALLVTAFLILSSQTFLQAQAQVQRQATIIESSGRVEILRANQTNWTSARKGQVLKQNDSIRTLANASAVLSVDSVTSPSLIRLESGTQIKLSDLSLQDTTGVEDTLLDMAIGDILIETEPKQGSKFQVKTPTSIVGARGTAFRVKEYES